MGGQGLLLLMEFKFFIMMTRPQNIIVATLLLMEFKFLIMMTRPQNIIVAILLAGNGNVLRPGHHYQKLNSINSKVATIMFCGLVIIMKNLNSINSRRPWPPILISHLFQHSLFLNSWPQLFLHQGCFG